MWSDLNSGLGSPLVQGLTLCWSHYFCFALVTLWHTGIKILIHMEEKPCTKASNTLSLYWGERKQNYYDQNCAAGKTEEFRGTLEA